MYARLLRWQDAAPSERDGLIPVDYDQYNTWSESARLAQIEYLEGKLTDEEFLRRIGMTQELTSYETRYPEVMQVLDLREPRPKWKLYTAEDLRREDQKGHQNLREKYGKGCT